MTFVVTEQCIRCKFTDCVDVCPVDCFHEGPNFLVIDPEVCIDCALCVPECPVDAIYEESVLPEEFNSYLQINAALSKTWPEISATKDPMPGSEEWADVPDKGQWLITEAEVV
ncbi:MAG: ferredoxin [Lentisphaeria bacterium]|jgi:ferredoxin